jgi:L-arabinose transport system ATP-binding protein
MESVLEFQNISKFFPGVRALDNVSFKAYGGEVLAFLGENGAGKSTLLKVLNGDYIPEEGKYLLNGEEKHFQSPHEAIEAGISVIYQERQILMELSVAENIFLGRMPANRFGVIDKGLANKMAQKIIDDFGLPIKPTTKVKDLSIAYQQMVEIMKAYSRENLKVICFDEPTASLSDAEIDTLFKIIEKLKNEGKIVIYVSHRMSEIHRIADKVAIFKDGRYMETVDAKTTPESEMIRLMVGRDLGDIYKNLDKEKTIGDVVLDVRNVSSDYVKPVSFQLRRGEVLGFSGLVGAGRTEIMRAIIGADKRRSGEIYLEGKKIENRSPKEAMDNGIVLVPEDRKLQGVISNLSVAGNINISLLDKNANKLGVIDPRKEKEKAQEGIREFNIKTPSMDKKIVELSGGNQQKCIVARGLATMPKVLILDEPTKGIDVGAKSEFYEMICRFAKQGISIILVSSELPEVIGLSDRIIVMRGLQIVGEIDAKEATEQKVLSLGMMGA